MRATKEQADEWIAEQRAKGLQVEDRRLSLATEPIRSHICARENAGEIAQSTQKMPDSVPLLRTAKRGRGVRREPGQMNGLEKKYAKRLDVLKAAGEVIEWQFDAVKLRLAPATFYTPDFLVMAADCTIEFHEAKGHWEDDARAKVKIAAALFPFVFRIVQFSKKTGWQIYEVSGKLKS